MRGEERKERGGGRVREEERRKERKVCVCGEGELTSSTNSCVLACKRLLKLSDSLDSSDTRSYAQKRL